MGFSQPIPNAEVLAELSILRSVHFRVLLPALMTFYSPYPRVTIPSMCRNYLVRLLV